MEWPKLKNIILILLLFTDLCLLALLGGPAWQNVQLQRQNRMEAIQLLNQKGIQVLEQDVPEQMTLVPQSARRNPQQEQQMAQKLLGEDVGQEVRGGEVYRYESEKGTLQFHSDGTFSLQINGYDFSGETKPEQAVQMILATLDMEVEVLEQTQHTITARQMWKETVLFDRLVHIEWDQEGQLRISNGSRILGTPIPVAGTQTITVATALITFFNGLDGLGDVCSEIRTISQGYITTTPLSGPMELTPVWHITTDSGIYQLDMVSGDLSRMS